MEDGRLTGQVAIVTGASTGIGRAAALALAAEGAKVAVVARSADKLETLTHEITAAGGTALAYAADVADAAAVDRFVVNVLHEWGQLDLFVANAGINTKQRNLHDMSVEQFDQVVAVDMNAVFYCAKATLPQMRSQGRGTFITVASMAALKAGPMSGVAYAAAKSGAVAITDSINAEERVNGIRATAILPGEVDTPILDQRPVPVSAAGRATMLQPEDVAAAIVFVATLSHRATIETLVIAPTVRRERVQEDTPLPARAARAQS